MTASLRLPAMRSNPRHRLQTGFTLIEMMIVVAIIAILAAIAVPSYADYMRRGQMPEAFSTMTAYRVKMEQYFQDNRSYGSDKCGFGAAGTPTWASKLDAGETGTKYFKVSCKLEGAGYVLTATGDKGRVSGYEYKLDHENKQWTSVYKTVKVTGKNCWMVRGTEC